MICAELKVIGVKGDGYTISVVSWDSEDNERLIKYFNTYLDAEYYIRKVLDI